VTSAASGDRSHDAVVGSVPLAELLLQQRELRTVVHREQHRAGHRHHLRRRAPPPVLRRRVYPAGTGSDNPHRPVASCWHAADFGRTAAG
jgi:hypothetical protein